MVASGCASPALSSIAIALSPTGHVIQMKQISMLFSNVSVAKYDQTEYL